MERVRDRLNAPAITLSGGQQQRLCLARVIALKPEILLLDEPTASLDFRATAKIEELLFELKQNYTVIAVSHSLSQASRLGDMVFIMKEGRIAGSFLSAEFKGSKIVDGLIDEVF